MRRLLICTALAMASTLAFAQGFPTKPVKVVVGYSPGGAVDLVARSVGQAMSGPLGQAVIVENKPGAGTNLAIKATIDAPADGYTLHMAANALAANVSLFHPAPYDLDRDLAPVSLIGRVPVVIAAPANSPYASVAALVQAAKAKPGAIGYASPGNGSTPHLAIELFAHAAGVDFLHVPYKGGTQAITDVIGGQVPLVAVNALEIQPHVKSGRLKVLAVMSPTRSAALPDAPTIAESGYPGFEASVWYGLVAPAATPKPVIARLHEAVQKALASADMRERMQAVGGEVVPGSTEQFAAMLRSERQRYERLIKANNIRPD